MLDSNRPDLDLVAIELKDDAVVVVGLRVDDLAQIGDHALWVSSAAALSGLCAQHRVDMAEKVGRSLPWRSVKEARLELARREAFARRVRAR